MLVLRRVHVLLQSLQTSLQICNGLGLSLLLRVFPLHLRSELCDHLLLLLNIFLQLLALLFNLGCLAQVLSHPFDLQILLVYFVLECFVLRND